MMNFIQQITNSIYNPDFYKSLDEKETSYTMFYLLKLSLLVSVISIVGMIIFVVSAKNEILANANVPQVSDLPRKYVENYYPADLILSYKNGNIHTNQTDPVFFQVPVSWLGDKANELKNIEYNLAVITPKEEYSDDLIGKYNSMLVLASTSLGFSNGGSIEKVKYSELKFDFDEIVVNKEIALNKATELKSYIEGYSTTFLLTLLTVMFVLIIIFAFLANLIFALFTGLVAFIISLALKSKSNYGAMYLKAIHADTFYILISATLGWVIAFNLIPFLNTLMVLFILYTNKVFESKG
jgi:hypothetical protein